MGGTVYWNGDTKTIDVVSAVPKAETVSTEDKIKEIAKKAESVLMVNVDKGSGSAFIVGDGRTALTNFHVVEGKNLAICNADNQLDSGYLYEVIKTDETNDLAVIRSKYDMYVSYNPLTLGDSDKVETGDTVIAIGSPLGFKNTVSDGIVSGFRVINGIEYIQITAPISPGSSGGALFNMDGEVIGITTATVIEGQNLNLAIPINKAKELLK
jgi:S1-C subfamily serine protease